MTDACGKPVCLWVAVTSLDTFHKNIFTKFDYRAQGLQEAHIPSSPLPVLTEIAT